MEEPSSKRIKLCQEDEAPIEPESNMIRFMDMNDDVLYAICQRLPLKDLCSVSGTCNRLHELAVQCFLQRYPNNRVDIEVYNWTIPNKIKQKWEYQISPKEEYTKAFREYIRNASLFTFNFERDPIRAFKLLKSKCNANLRELTLYNIVCETESYGELIQTQLKNLQRIEFKNCHIHDMYGGFLKHCPSLRQIAIDERRKSKKSVMEWTKHHYPQLKSFKYHSGKVVIKSLEEFFDHNPQINIVCSGTKVFRLLAQKNWKLDRLHVEFNRNDEFRTVAHQIETYCGHGHVKRLEMSFRHEWDVFSELDIVRLTELLPALDVLQGLHIKHVSMDMSYEFVNLLKRLKQLKVISFGIDRIFKKLRHILAHLPNLEEFHFDSISNEENGLRFRKLLRTFAVNAPNIKVISIRSVTNIKFIDDSDIMKINQLRKNTPNSRPFTIYLDYVVIEEANFTVPSNSLVHVKPFSEMVPDHRKNY